MNHQHHEEGKNMPNKNFRVVSIAVATFFVVIIGVLAYSVSQKNADLNAKYDELNSVHTLYADLDDSYHSALSDLDYFKNGNQEMNDIIEMQKAELTARRDEIANLLKDRGKLQHAREKIIQLESQATLYLNQIELLEDENLTLTSENKALVSQKEKLFSRLNEQAMQNEKLSEAHAVLVSRNEELNRSVRLGSVVKVDDVKVEGLKVRTNGKVKESKVAEKVEELRVCFKTMPNDVVQPGIETFFVRIVNPRGETLAIEDLGSGMLRLNDNGEAVRVTSGAEVEYKNEVREVCMVWAPGIAFTSGDYQVEVYNKGRLSGAGAFSLK